MIHPHLEEILRRIVEELSRLYGERMVEVRLFGSQARREATGDSDIDLLVVLRDEEVHISHEQDAFFPFKYKLEREYDVLIQIIFTSQKRLQNSHSPLYVAVREESVVV